MTESDWEHTLKVLHHDMKQAEIKSSRADHGMDLQYASDMQVELMMARHKFNSAMAHWVQSLAGTWEES
jgi:hypothetical protein